MTDFAALLLADRGQPARRLTLLAASGFDAWLTAQSERTRATAAATRFTAKPGSLLIVPGDGSDWDAVAGVPETPLGPWDLAAAATALPGGSYRITEAALHLGPLAGLGWLLAQHKFNRYRSSVEPEPARVLLVPGDPTDTVRLAEATALVRDLVDTPAADMGPAEIAAVVQAQARSFGAEVKVITGEALIDAGFPAVHAVGRAATAAPRLIDLCWGDPVHPKLSLVGKGVSFDSGGLDIKPASGMALMKKDMGGAAHAIALARLVMQARLPVRLRLIVPAVENAISGNAFRPGDVLASRKGLTIEIGNTDAEGRLILADALALACEEAPDLLLDFATLTGAARVALGPELPALFTHDDDLAAALAAAGTATGDPLWRMPLWPGYADMLKSSIADLNNAGEGGFAGAVTAALFLDRFVTKGVCWAHFDLYAWNPTAKPGRPKGGAAMTLAACWAVIRARFASAIR